MSKSKKVKGVLDSPTLPPMESPVDTGGDVLSSEAKEAVFTQVAESQEEVIGHSDGIEVDSERPDYCKRCDRRFGSESANRAHQREEHK